MLFSLIQFLIKSITISHLFTIMISALHQYQIIVTAFLRWAIAFPWLIFEFHFIAFLFVLQLEKNELYFHFKLTWFIHPFMTVIYFWLRSHWPIVISTFLQVQVLFMIVRLTPQLYEAWISNLLLVSAKSKLTSQC